MGTVRVDRYFLDLCEEFEVADRHGKPLSNKSIDQRVAALAQATVLVSQSPTKQHPKVSVSKEWKAFNFIRSLKNLFYIKFLRRKDAEDTDYANIFSAVQKEIQRTRDDPASRPSTEKQCVQERQENYSTSLRLLSELLLRKGNLNIVRPLTTLKDEISKQITVLQSSATPQNIQQLDALLQKLENKRQELVQGNPGVEKQINQEASISTVETQVLDARRQALDKLLTQMKDQAKQISAQIHALRSVEIQPGTALGNVQAAIEKQAKEIEEQIRVLGGQKEELWKHCPDTHIVADSDIIKLREQLSQAREAAMSKLFSLQCLEPMRAQIRNIDDQIEALRTIQPGIGLDQASASIEEQADSIAKQIEALNKQKQCGLERFPAFAEALAQVDTDDLSLRLEGAKHETLQQVANFKQMCEQCKALKQRVEGLLAQLNEYTTQVKKQSMPRQQAIDEYKKLKRAIKSLKEEIGTFLSTMPSEVLEQLKAEQQTLTTSQKTMETLLQAMDKDEKQQATEEQEVPRARAAPEIPASQARKGVDVSRRQIVPLPHFTRAKRQKIRPPTRKKEKGPPSNPAVEAEGQPISLSSSSSGWIPRAFRVIQLWFGTRRAAQPPPQEEIATSSEAQTTSEPEETPYQGSTGGFLEQIRQKAKEMELRRQQKEEQKRVKGQQ